MKKKKGFTLIELLVVIAIIAMLLAILMPALGKVKKLAMRLVCGTNLKGMANAMNVYAFDYRDEYPIAGGKGAGPKLNGWTGTTTKWDDPAVSNKATLSVAASLFMLVREADVGVKSFICTGSDQQEFVNTQTEHGSALAADNDVVELWDFGATPGDHQSYAYQLPYENPFNGVSNFPADGTSSPGNAIMGDRNPWFDPTLDAGAPLAEEFLGIVAVIDWDAPQKFLIQVGNSAPHDREGQNVLFNDGHVSFEKSPDVGTRYDNIYVQLGGNGQTPRTDEQRRQAGRPNPVGSTQVKNREDSVLVNDTNCKG